MGIAILALTCLAGLLTFAQTSAIDRTLKEQVLAHATQHRPFFVAAFSGPLLTRDYAEVAAIVEESVGRQGLAYLIVKDRANRIVAARGWDLAKAPIPSQIATPTPNPDGDLVVPFIAAIRVGDQFLGEVCFGLSYGHVVDAKRNLLILNASIAFGALLLILIAIDLLYSRVTRPLVDLAQASDRIRSGIFDVPQMPASKDEFGDLAAAFYRMSAEIKRRIATLTAAEEKQRGMLLEATERGEQLRLAKEAAERATRVKSDFLANMSHELRTPLNAIIGFSELMQAETLGTLGNPRYKRYCADIYNSGQHLLAIINDILDLTSVERGITILNEEPLSVATLLHDTAAMVAASPAAAEIPVIVAPVEKIPQITGDLRLLRQIMLNLASNAVKFSRPGGKVTMSARIEQNGDIAIEVEDEGIGIAASNLAIVMEPFVQVEAVSSRRHHGTGLGLAITKRFAELHGGRLELKSELGKGTTARLVLPAARLVRSAIEQTLVA